MIDDDILSVLVVEDHPDTRSALAEYFAERGWEVWSASDGDAALCLARERCPDLVCLDLNLPRSSGYEVCEQFRSDPTLAHVAILMVSARRSVDVRAYAIEAGADAYLAKPYDLDELVGLAQRLCDDRASRARDAQETVASTGAHRSA